MLLENSDKTRLIFFLDGNIHHLFYQLSNEEVFSLSVLHYLCVILHVL